MDESPLWLPVPRTLAMNWLKTGRRALKAGVSALAMLWANTCVERSWSVKRDSRM
jgi:hypothetical protein